MPRKIIEMMDDMHLSSQSTFLDYYYAMQTNNISYANTLLSSNPSLANQIMTADNINTLLNETYNRELQPKIDIDYYLAGLEATYESMILNTRVRGEWSADIEYQVHNLVFYNGKGYFVYTNNKPPKGTLPTDTTYWREYDIKGYQGYGGINLNFKGNWDGTQNYVKNDVVIYQNKLWYALADNTDYEPNLNHYPWVIISMPKLPNKTPIQRALPTGYDVGDFWWQITEGEEVISTTWGIRQSEPTPRFASAAFSIGTKIYIVGGRLANFNETNVNEVFDTDTGTWSVEAAASTTRSRATGFTIGTTGYVIGGIDENGNILDTNEAYDSTTNTWSVKASLPIPMISPGISYNSKGYVVGGETTHNVLVGNSYVYDADANTWTAIADKPTLTHGHTVAANNGVLYAIGGVDANKKTLGITEAYDIATNTWSQKDTLIVPRSYLSSFVKSGNIYAVGGLNSNWYSMNTNEKYNIADNEWTSDMPMNYSRSSLNALISDTKGFAIGGIDMGTSSVMGYNEQYDVQEIPADFEMNIDTTLEVTNYIVTQQNQPIETESDENLVTEEDADSSDRLTVTLPLTSTGEYNFIVDWGDGTTSTRITAYDDAQNTHTYTANGEYTIKLTGVLTELKFEGTKLATYLKSITKCDLGFTTLKDMFKGCTNLSSLPDGMFNVALNVTDASGVFNGCHSLQIVPSELFINNISINTFANAFANCALTSIPTGFFNGNNGVKDFTNVFMSCTNLQSIPANLFDNQSQATTFEGAFDGCLALATVPSNLFANCPLVTTYKNVFRNCKALTTITKDIFGDSIPSATTLEGVFRGTGITKVPENMFKDAPLVTCYDYVFYDTSIIVIPEYCFAGGNNATSENAWDRTKIAEIDGHSLEGLNITEGFLANMPALQGINNEAFGSNKLTTLKEMFSGDSALILAGRIDASEVTDATDCFKGCTELVYVNGFEHLFTSTTYVPSLSVSISFEDCTKLNHDSLINISNTLKTMTEDTIQTLTLSSESLALLTDVEKMTIINKWWNLAGYTPSITEDFAKETVIGLEGDNSSTATVIATTNLYYYITLTSSDGTDQGTYAITQDRGMIYKYNEIPEEEYGVAYSVNDSEAVNIRWIPKGKDGDPYWASYSGKLRQGLQKLSEDVSNITNIIIGAAWNNNKYIQHPGINGDTEGVNENAYPLYTFLADVSNISDPKPLFPNLKGIQINMPNSGDSFTAKNICGLFRECSNLTNVYMEGFDSSKTENMGSLFAGCSSLTNDSLSFLEDWSNDVCTQMYSMFDGCSKLTSMVNIKMPAVTNAMAMYYASGITSITGGYLGTKIEDATGLFQECTSLTTLPSDYTTVFGHNSNLTNVSNLFYKCTSLKNVGVHCVQELNTDTFKYDINTTKLNNQLFTYCPNITNMSGICAYTQVGADSNNAGIPTALFYHCTKLTNASYAFESCKYIDPPSVGTAMCDIFTKNNPELENIEGMFKDASSPKGVITENAGAGGTESSAVLLFPGTKIKNASHLYDGYSCLNEGYAYNIPFIYRSKVLEDVSYMYANQTAFTGLDDRLSSYTVYPWTNVSTYCPALKNCSYMFYKATALTGTGTPFVTAFSKISTLTTHNNVFTGCTGLSDYSSISSDWK